jgi:hypothetical protein
VQNKANFDLARAALIVVTAKTYERCGHIVRLRKQSQFAALRLLRRRAPRNDMTTHVTSERGKICLRERRHETRRSVQNKANFLQSDKRSKYSVERELW